MSLERRGGGNPRVPNLSFFFGLSPFFRHESGGVDGDGLEGDVKGAEPSTGSEAGEAWRTCQSNRWRRFGVSAPEVVAYKERVPPPIF